MKFAYVITMKNIRWVHNPEQNQDGYSEDLPDTQVEVELDIDLDRLVKRLGTKAANNKTGRSTILGGIITMRKVYDL